MADVLIGLQFAEQGLPGIIASYKQLEDELTVGAEKLRGLYAGGQIGEEEFSAGMKTISSEMGNVRSSMNLASTGVEQLSEKQTTLHEVLGTSRRETMFFEQQLLSLTGVSGVAAKGVEALATGLGGVGLAIVGVSFIAEGFKAAMNDLTPSIALVNKELDAVVKKSEAAAELAKFAGVELVAASSALTYAKAHEEAAVALQKVLAGSQQATPVISGLTGAFNTAMTAAAQLAILSDAGMQKQLAMVEAMREGKSAAEVEAAGYNAMHIAIQGMTDAHKEAIAEQIRNINLTSEAANQTVTFTEQVWDSAAATKADADALVAADKALALVAGGMHSVKDATGDVTIETYRATDALTGYALAAGVVVQANVAMMRSDNDAAGMKKFLADQAYKDNITAGNEAKRASDQAIALGVTEAKAAEAKAQQLYASYEKQAEGMLKVSAVTAQDLKDAAAGTYKDKDDENIRRMRSVVVSPTLDNENIKLMPAAIQQQLKDAFAKGGAAGLKLTAQDLVAQGENFSNPAMWNVAKMAGDLKAAVAANENKLKMADMIVKESGLDASNPVVQKFTQALTGGDAVAGGAASLKTSIEAQLKTFKPGDFIMAAVTADANKIIEAGQRLAGSVMAGIYSIAKDEDFATKFVKALVPTLDGWYARKGSVGVSN